VVGDAGFGYFFSMSWKTLASLFAAVALTVFSGTAATAAPERPLTVVELFTSQGCSSCPPADALLGDLAKRDDVLALSFNVDYWDYIGWKDPFASAANTARQHAYASALGLSYVYTPQMVINGVAQEVGSRRDSVLDLIAHTPPADTVAVAAWRDDDALRITLPATEMPDGAEASILVVEFDGKHKTHVRRGENSGRTLFNFNVVRELRTLRKWDGREVKLSLPLEDLKGDACAVLVQMGNAGPIIGAAKVVLN
jgi:hypothetical protein